MTYVVDGIEFHIKDFNAVKRWLRNVHGSGIRSEATEIVYLHFLKRFCDHTGKTPDQLILERREHLKSQDELTQRLHEESLTDWRNHLETEKGLARSSVVTAHNVIRSFYKANYATLQVKSPTSWAATRRKVPTREELRKMFDVCTTYRDRALILVLAQSGISLGDLKLVTWNLIEKEYEAGVEPLHLALERSKVKKQYDTFLGSDALGALSTYFEDVGFPQPMEPILHINKRTVQQTVKDVSLRAELTPHVTPHKLRSFFNTYLKLEGCPNAQVEYWMGHTIPYGGAYFVPPVEDQRRLYRRFEYAISITERSLEDRVSSLVAEFGEAKVMELLKK